MEERVHVVVFAQPGIARLAAGQVADERRLGDLPALEPGADVELRRVAVLVVARVHVEVEAPGQLAAVPHLPALHRGMPDGGVRHALELHVEQLRRDVEHALFDLLVRQVGAQILRVERVIALPHLLGVVGEFPEVHHGGARDVLLPPREQLRVLPHLALARGGHAAIDERARRGGVAGHLVGHDAVGVVREPERQRQLVPLLAHMVQDLDVLRVRPVLVRHVHAAAQIVALRVRRDRRGRRRRACGGR